MIGLLRDLSLFIFLLILLTSFFTGILRFEYWQNHLIRWLNWSLILPAVLLTPSFFPWIWQLRDRGSLSLTIVLFSITFGFALILSSFLLYSTTILDNGDNSVERTKYLILGAVYMIEFGYLIVGQTILSCNIYSSIDTCDALPGNFLYTLIFGTFNSNLSSSIFLF